MNDRVKELKAFEDTKSGVKGLVDSGITNLPKIFIRPPDELAEELNYGRGELKNLQVPIIDLAGIESDDLDRRKEIICEVKQASKDWGFFQVLNHGVPLNVMSSMLDGIRMFHEQDAEMKQKLYSGDRMKTVTYGSNTVDLYRSSAASWRDTLSILLMLEDHIEPEELPEICRDSAIEYMNHLTKLGETLFEILSEALGLERDHILSAVGSGSGRAFICHYYPACPQPELTLGITKHTDPTFMTILLQDQIGGLQVFRDNAWVDIQPQPGTFVVNIGDFLQIVSNDAFKSGEHRVVANKVGPRISVASFFGGVAVPPKVYGPIQELISEENPPLYKEFTVGDFMSKTYSRPFGKSALEDFRLQG